MYTILPLVCSGQNTCGFFASAAWKILWVQWPETAGYPRLPSKHHVCKGFCTSQPNDFATALPPALMAKQLTSWRNSLHLEEFKIFPAKITLRRIQNFQRPRTGKSYPAFDSSPHTVFLLWLFQKHIGQMQAGNQALDVLSHFHLYAKGLQSQYCALKSQRKRIRKHCRVLTLDTLQ